MTDRSPLPRTIRGGRPVFFDDPAIDKVLAMLLSLASEVWAQRERLAAVESIARARGVLQAGEVDAHRFAEDDSRHLDALRREFIDNLFRVLKVEARKRGAANVAPEVPSAGAKVLRGPRAAARQKSAERPAKRSARKKTKTAKPAATRRTARGARRSRR